MKKIQSVIFVLLLSFSGYGQSVCKKVNIKGKVTFTAIYKGGARPTPEVLEACCQPKPMANAKLYLKKNYYSPAQYIITTGAEGNFKKRVKQGSYNVFLKNEVDDVKAKEIAGGKTDQNNAWLTEPYFVMNVVSLKSFTIDIRERRDPNEIPRP